MITNVKIFGFEDYMDIAEKHWPRFNIKWDLDYKKSILANEIPESMFTDGSLSFHFPEGFIIGWVNLNDLLDKMIPSIKRDSKNWKNDLNPIKIAKIISQCVNGATIYPPYVDICDTGINIRNGYHRLYICLTKKISKIPILISYNNKNNFARELQDIEWIEKYNF